MLPLRDLQDDPKHEKLQGLREEAVLQRVSLCCRGAGRCCGVCWGAPTSAQTAPQRVLGVHVKPWLEGSHRPVNAGVKSVFSRLEWQLSSSGRQKVGKKKNSNASRRLHGVDLNLHPLKEGEIKRCLSHPSRCLGRGGVPRCAGV